MRHVGYFAIWLAAAVLASSAAQVVAQDGDEQGWHAAGTSPRNLAVLAPESPALDEAPLDEPSLAPPESVEGSWVADEGQPRAAQPAIHRHGAAYGGHHGIHHGVPHGNVVYEGQYGDGQYDDGSCEDGSCEGDSYGHGHPFGFLHAWHRRNCLLYGDLWTEVHSHRRIYVKTEYLLWRGKGEFVPPLVTSSPIGTDQADAGVLPDAEVLFGNEEQGNDQQSGGRINVGYWLVDGEFVGIEGHYFNLHPSEESFSASSVFSDGTLVDPILARPFLNLDPAIVPDADSPFEDAVIVAFPGFTPPAGSGLAPFDLDGSISVRNSSEVQSAGALLRHLVWIDFTGNWRLDFLGGYRFFRLNNELSINDSFNFPGQGLIAAVQFDSTDEFNADNEFHGGELGLVAQIHRCRWSLEASAKIAMGENFQDVNIAGTHSTTTLGVTATAPGGFLAQPTNIGLHERDTFAILPEANLTLRYDITHNLRATFGYSYMFLSKVVRSADQIDLTINPTQIDGALDLGNPPDQNFARPRFQFRETDYWLYGFNAGFEYRW